MEVHTLLSSDVGAFDFKRTDLTPLEQRFPDMTLHCHRDDRRLPDALATADYVLTWTFQADWYARSPNLKSVFTPAAGNDWVAADPAGRVELVHGTFHGPLLGESLLGAILFMNRRMPAMIDNYRRREWNREIQQDCRRLAGQTILIIGFGHIGVECARILLPMGARIIGIKRNPERLPGSLSSPPGDVEVRSLDRLEDTLPEADHVVVILPGGTDTDRILDERRIRLCKPGVYLYNFGRGNAIAGADLARAHDHVGGAFLDVVEEEPLGRSSPLWSLDNVMITPHSSCIGREYKQAFLDEVAAHLARQPA